MNLSAKIRLLRVGGFSNGASYIHEQISIHSRLDELQSAILRVKLKHLDEWTARRCAVAEVYNERLSKLPITLPPRDDNKKHVYHQYVIRTDKRDELFRHFMRRDIGCKVHYKTPVHLQPAYSHLGLEEGAFPNAENAAKEMLSLPINPFLTESEVEKVCEVIEEFYK